MTNVVSVFRKRLFILGDLSSQLWLFLIIFPLVLRTYLVFAISGNKGTCLKPLKIIFTITCSTLESVLAEYSASLQIMWVFSVGLCNNFLAHGLFCF